MVKRQCPKCNALFDRKSHYDYHINRKFDCSKKKVIDNDEINLCQNMLFCAEIMPKYAKLGTKTNLEVENEKTPDKNEENHLNNQVFKYQDLCCQYCKKNFSSKSTLTRHLKSNCKVKKENDEEKENIFKLLLEKDLQHKEELKNHKEEMEELKKQNKLIEKQNKLLMDKIDKLIQIKDNPKISNTINNNQKITNNTKNDNSVNTQNNNQKITNNTQNNIVMVNFGKEDLSIIDERQFIEKIVKKPTITGVKIPDEVLKIIHFNPQYPQLSNIYISDINREKCMVYEDGEWKLSNIDNIPQIMDKICIFSKDQIDMLREKYPNNKAVNDRLDTVEKYNNYIDDDFVQDLKEDDDYNNNKLLIERAEDFQKYTYNTIKKTLYNEGKKLKKTNKQK
jgi:hypothetical protein